MPRLGGSGTGQTGSDPALWALLGLGLLLRLVFAAGHMGIVHADEVFQYLDQAHRVVFGEGVVPWEYQVQARSWILPGLLLPATWLQQALSLSPAVLHGLVVLQMAVLGLLPVYAGYRLGMRAMGPRAALFAGLLNAAWFECVFYSTHFLPDTLAAALLPMALWCAVSAGTDRGRLVAGVLWGLVIATRIQLGPVVALGLLLTGWPRLRGMIVQGLGVLLVVAGYGLVDLVTLGSPFASVLNYVRWNVVENVASGFGVWPWWSYGASFVLNWLVALPLVAVVALFGVRAAALEWTLALAVVGLLSLIGHKEERFIYPAIPLMMTACGIGSAALLAWVGRRWTFGLGVAGLAGVWLALSLVLSLTPRFGLRAERGTASAAAMRTASERAEVCGLGILPSRHFVATGGQSWLRPGTPIYAADTDAPDFNAVLAEDGAAPAGFTEAGCWAEPRGQTRVQVCLWVRPGGCRAGGAPPATLPVPQGVADALARRGRG